MNQLIIKLFKDSENTLLIKAKLPPAFQTVENELKGNPAIGLLREQVLLGMLSAFLGERNVRIPRSGVEADVDCYVDGQPLSIKTVSSTGGIRLKWTSNAVKAQEFIRDYAPISDLLIVRIDWGKVGYLKYIPLTAQSSIFRELGPRYLDYRGQTNTRGVNLSAEAETRLNRHINTITLPLLWRLSGEVANPLDKWIRYWRE